MGRLTYTSVLPDVVDSKLFQACLRDDWDHGGGGGGALNLAEISLKKVRFNDGQIQSLKIQRCSKGDFLGRVQSNCWGVAGTLGSPVTVLQNNLARCF